MSSERNAKCCDRISYALKVKGMKQSELCRITNIPKSAISQYISGAFEPKQDRVYLISKALNVSETWLMGYDVPMDRQESKPLDQTKLTEGEQMLLDLFRNTSEDKQQLFLQILRVAQNNQE